MRCLSEFGTRHHYGKHRLLRSWLEQMPETRGAPVMANSKRSHSAASGRGANLISIRHQSRRETYGKPAITQERAEWRDRAPVRRRRINGVAAAGGVAGVSLVGYLVAVAPSQASLQPVAAV